MKQYERVVAMIKPKRAAVVVQTHRSCEVRMIRLGDLIRSEL